MGGEQESFIHSHLHPKIESWIASSFIPRERCQWPISYNFISQFYVVFSINFVLIFHLMFDINFSGCLMFDVIFCVIFNAILSPGAILFAVNHRFEF
jgi:NADH:ubiquinone oxidoreductase subunit 3 (subunit A)